MRLQITLLPLCLILACGGAKNTVIPTDMEKWETDLAPVVKKLNEEERGLLAGYMMRAKMGEAFGGAPMPAGMTIGKAIEDQRTWMSNQSKREAEAAALKLKLEAEKKAIQKQVGDMLTVAVLGLKVQKGSWESGQLMDRQIIKIGFNNKGSKDIAGIKGTVHFIDMFDAEIGTVSFSYDDGVASGKTATWLGSRDFNQFLAEHKALANLQEGKYKYFFEPEMIVFSDGSKIAVPSE